FVRHIDGGLQYAAGVVAQIEHQALELPAVVLLQLFELLVEALAGLGLELGNADVAVAGFKHLAAHTGELDQLALEFEHQRLGNAFTYDRQRNLGAGIALHTADRVVDRQALHRRLIDLDDQVTGLDAGARGGRVVDRRHHFDEAVLALNFDAEATVLA